MIKCNKCGSMNEDDASSCTNCGYHFVRNEQYLKITPQDMYINHNKKIKSSPIYTKWEFWVLLLVITIGVVYFINRSNPATYIQASPKQEPFLRTGGFYDMDIDTDGDWEISYCSDWITAKPIEKGLRIICSSNNSGENRKGWITLSSGKTHVRIDVYQNGFASYIKIDKSHLNVGKAGGTYTLTVQTDGEDFNVQYPNYCTVNTSTASFRITIPENNGWARTDNVTVYSDKQAINLTFSQKGLCPICDGTGEMICGKCGGSGNIITGYDYFGNTTIENCTDCNGSGKLECTTCEGTGIQ